MPVKSVRLGPGTLKLGPTGVGQLDVSPQLQNGVVSWDKNKDDDLTVITGEVIAGATTFTSKLSGTFVQDLATGGVVGWSWTNKGTPMDFEFVPNTTNGAKVVGKLVPTPLDIGSTDDYGSIMTADFEWDVVGIPTLTPGTLTTAEAEAAETPVELDPVA